MNTFVGVAALVCRVRWAELGSLGWGVVGWLHSFVYRLILGDFHQHGKQLGKMGFLIVLRCACLVESLDVGSDYSALCIQMLDYVRVRSVILESLPQIHVWLVRWKWLGFCREMRALGYVSRWEMQLLEKRAYFCYKMGVPLCSGNIGIKYLFLIFKQLVFNK